MKAAIAISGVAREDLYITTKYDALNGEDVRAEFDKSLKKVHPVRSCLCSHDLLIPAWPSSRSGSPTSIST